MVEEISCFGQIGFPVLSVIAYIPLLGAIILLFFKKTQENAVRWFANIVAIIDFLFSLLIIPGFIKDHHCIQFVEKIPWIQSLGIQYYFGIDGISVLLILLTTFLGVLAILSS
ncbi:NADH-quinone oxidoreductase subunit M, partial [bacterium]|nr:NADH-quinone oxidoreductase subunit M [bacterium]